MLKKLDFVASAADERGKPATLSSLGYSGGVNESVSKIVETSEVTLAAIIVIDSYYCPVADAPVKKNNRNTPNTKVVKEALVVSSVGKKAGPHSEPLMDGESLEGSAWRDEHGNFANSMDDRLEEEI